MIKDKESTWQMSCRESLKREQEVLVMVEELKAPRSVDENTTATIIRGLKRIRNLVEEKDTLKELLEDEREWKELEDYMTSWDAEKMIASTLSTQIWQMTQSNATKVENLENDFIELSSKTKELGSSDEKSNPKCWLEKRDNDFICRLVRG